VPLPRLSLPCTALSLSILAAILIGGCASSATPTPAAPGPALVVIVGPDHVARLECVPLETPQVSGRQLMDLAGIETTLDERNPMGALVCAIEGEGCAFPAEDCLCQCEGLGDCAYWASFVRTPPGEWTYAGQGVSSQPLHPGDLYAWVWLPTAASSEALEWLPAEEVAGLCP
jgi:hypothetical protein